MLGEEGMEGEAEARDEIEVVEIGEGDIALLLAALKRLNNGVYALKVTLDFLSSRVGTLQSSISSLEKALKEHLELFSREIAKHGEEERVFLEKLKAEVGGIPKEVRLSLDMFLEKLSSELEQYEELSKMLESDISALRSQVKETQLVVADFLTGVKGSVGELKAKTSEMEAVLAELSQRVSRLEETTLAGLRELRLALQDLSLQLASLREKLLGTKASSAQ